MIRTLRPVQLVVDFAIALVFALLPLGSVLGGVLGGALGGASDLSDLLVQVVMAVALGLRRLSPGIALGVAWAGATLQMGLHATAPAFADLAVLAVLYATAAYGGRMVRWLGLGSALLGALVASLYLVVLPIVGSSGGYSSGGFSSVALRAVGFTVFACLSALVLSWTLGQLVRLFARAAESRRAQASAERDVVVEQERNRIARDMHDVVAHSLAVVIAQADGALYARSTNPTAVDGALTTIATTAREALGDVRVLLTQLRHSDGESPQPVLADLDRLLDQLRAAGLSIAVEEHGSVSTLAAGQQLAVYRIVQEALTNVLRHGDTEQEVRVLFDWQEALLTLSIESATRPDVVPNPGGHGLAGMRERAILSGGAFTVEDRDGSYLVKATMQLTAPVLAR